ncbi:MAG TPA: histidine phosphotransferase family protein [Acetobacteraceae bacterium]|nr:histidine phosphotransferase family protein [Acetobacteraceae bacterium]
MPTLKDPLRLAELLCGRISHDLAGMIGTLAGALELTGDPSVAAEAIALARHSAIEARQRLEVLRASWGPELDPLALPTLQTLAEGLPQVHRCRLDMSGLPHDTVFSPSFARVLLNLLLLATESLHGSGTIALSGGATDLIIAISGPRAAWPAGLLACLADESAAWDALADPNAVQMPLTVLLARAAGLRLSLLLPSGPNGPTPPLRLQKV